MIKYWDGKVGFILPYDTEVIFDFASTPVIRNGKLVCTCVRNCPITSSKVKKGTILTKRCWYIEPDTSNWGEYSL